MRFESCLAVLLTSLVVIAVGSIDDDDNNPHILAFDGEILHPKHREDKRNSNDDATEKRSKRSLSNSDRNTVLYNFNYQRSTVGASDMNYLDYDIALEADLSNWTSHCNYDADFYSDYKCFILRYTYSSNRSYADDIQRVFGNPYALYAATSIYVSRVAGSVDYCPTITVNGTRYRNAYLRAYGFLKKSFRHSKSVQQYTLGPACTRCQSTVSWCYDNLCRDDCSLSIYGCCQISNGVKTAVCATKSGATGAQATGTAILRGLFLIIICYYFQ